MLKKINVLKKKRRKERGRHENGNQKSQAQKNKDETESARREETWRKIRIETDSMDDSRRRESLSQ